MSEHTCKTCKFWEPVNYDLDRGECRRYPPLAQSVPYNGQWPVTDPRGWCGEHQPKDATND